MSVWRRTEDVITRVRTLMGPSSASVAVDTTWTRTAAPASVSLYSLLVPLVGLCVGTCLCVCVCVCDCYSLLGHLGGLCGGECFCVCVDVCVCVGTSVCVCVCVLFARLLRVSCSGSVISLALSACETLRSLHYSLCALFKKLRLFYVMGLNVC